MSIKSFLLMSAATIAIAIPSIAHAEDAAPAEGASTPAPWAVSGSAALTSDYIFRGISQTQEKPAVQAGATLAHSSGFSASIWGSSVDFNDGDEATVELDGTLSYSRAIGPGTATIGGIYYYYPQADSSLNYDYFEAFVGYAVNVMKVADLNLQFFYSPEFQLESGNAQYLNLGVNVPIKPVEGLAFQASAGYQWIQDNAAWGTDDYTDYSAGLAYTYNKATFSIKYYGTDLDDNDNAEDRVVAAVSYAFP